MAVRKETQKQKILAYIDSHGSITPMDALNKFGCMRLGARIYELKQEGYPIQTEIEVHKNLNGEYVQYARYSL